MEPRGLFHLIVLGCLVLNSTMASADEVVGTARLLSAATVENIAYTDNSVSGQVVNRSNKRLENVQLLVTYAWLWADDRRTGESGPGFSAYHALDDAIAPNAAVSFTYPHKSVQAERSDGEFLPSVRIVGFTEFDQR
jgi:hypothetical protein